MPPIPASRRRLFILVTLLLTVAAGLLACEAVLRWRQAAIQNSNQLDSAIFRSDSLLGWRLNPGASGAHRHHDFSAHYQINSDGLRSTVPPAQPTGAKVLLLGDSFTFGLGVNDSETFASRLNQSQSAIHFVNCGFPGYSTDQEYLILQQKITAIAPDHVILAIYLGNDIFDNSRAYPLQLNQPKPVFSLNSAGDLDFTPASENRNRRPSDDLPQLIFGQNYSPSRSFPLIPQTLQSLGLIRDPLESTPFDPSEFLQRQDDSLALTFALIQKIRHTVQLNASNLHLLLLAGRSFVEQPSSTSAQFQDTLRLSLLRFSEHEKIPCFDAGSHLQNIFKFSPAPLFFPHDGHLTVLGHQATSEFIRTSFELTPSSR